MSVPTIKEQEIYKKQKVTEVILNTTGTKNLHDYKFVLLLEHK